MKTNIFYGLSAVLLTVSSAYAEDIDTNVAQMQAMDKITGRVNMIEVPVGGEVKFGTFSVVVRACKTRPEEEVPENSAFVDVTDKSFDEEEFNIFKGWMFSSSPAVNAIEHPIYDVWLIRCFNGELNPELLLTEEQLAARDNLPSLREIKNQQDKGKTANLPISETIQFKDSIYKVENPENLNTSDTQENNGGPENLLNIKEDYKILEEETVIIPADELSEALNTESEILKQQNPSSDNMDVAEENSAPINDDLAAAIEEELAKHNFEE